MSIKIENGIEKTTWRFQVYAECMDCGIIWESANAQSCAARHTRKTGHWTHVQQGIATNYKPIKREEGL